MIAALLLALLHFPVVLMYHRVDVSAPADAVSRALTVSPAQFQAEMATLARHGYAGIGIDEYDRLLREHRPVGRVVLLTFDDGYRDQYAFAVPILQSYGFSATFFVNTRSVGTRGHLSWEELRAMALAGMSIEAHGVDHVDLAGLPPGRQAFEIRGCIEALQARLRVPVTAFAYPSGGFDAATLRLVQKYGLRFAFTTDAARRLWPNSPYDLSRIRIKSGLRERRFSELIGVP